MGRLVLVLVLVVGAQVARAEPEPLPPPNNKSLVDAYLVTIAATAGPIAASMLVLGDDARGVPATIGGVIATTALVLGPSAGHWYAGRIWTTGLMLRLSGLAVVGGLVLYDQWRPLDDVGAMIVGGLAVAALWETGVIWDAVTLPRAVRRYNREHARPVVLAPFVTDRSAGLGLAGSF